jgi:hypothetical protein
MSMMLALALLTTNPLPDVTRERVDEIQVHFFFNEDNGHLVFSQFLFRRLKPDGSLQIDAWRMAKGSGGDKETICLDNGEIVTVYHELPKSDATPRWNHNRKCFELWLKDGDMLRCIEARTLSESGLWYDPEVEERNVQGREKRTDLMQPRIFRK